MGSREPLKRVRSKKPIGAPTRPKSAYMFFLGEFREKWKVSFTLTSCSLFGSMQGLHIDIMP